MHLNRQIKIRQFFFHVHVHVHIMAIPCTIPPNLSPPIVLKMSFRAKPPNLMTANIFDYMVVVLLSHKNTLAVGISKSIDQLREIHGCTIEVL